MFRLICLIAVLGLAACTDWPDVETPRSTEGTISWPELLPLATLPTSQGAASEEDANDLLLRRAAALRARAEVLRRPVPDNDAFEELRSRLQR